MGTLMGLGMLEVATNSKVQQLEWRGQGGVVITLHQSFSSKTTPEGL